MSYRPYNFITPRSVTGLYVNNSGTTIPKGTVVRVTVLGEIDFVDVTSEADSFAAFGIAYEDILDGESGQVVNSGRVMEYVTAFDIADTLYVDKTGALTNIKPEIGVNGFIAGDYIVRACVVVRNEDNLSNKDLLVDVKLVGQL